MRTWDLRYEYDVSMISHSLIFVLEITSSFQRLSNLAGEKQTGEESQHPGQMPVG